MPLIYSLILPNGKLFVDRNDNDRDNWPLHIAKIIARNVAMKHRCVVSLAPYVEEFRESTEVEQQSYTDKCYAHALSLRGKALTEALVAYGLPKGSDAVASKRERLVAHWLKAGQL